MKISELKQIIVEEIQKVLQEEKQLTAREKKLAAMRPPKDKITRGDVIAAAQKKKAGQLDERELTDTEEKKKEEIYKSLKHKKGLSKSRKFAIATAAAKKQSEDK